KPGDSVHGWILDVHACFCAIGPWTLSSRRPLLSGMNTNMSTQGTTVVLGGTGKTGRRVAERLQARGIPTRGARRSGGRPFASEGRSTWGPTLQRASAAEEAFLPDSGAPRSARTL